MIMYLFIFFLANQLIIVFHTVSRDAIVRQERNLCNFYYILL
jgi:hypothetical protein